MRVVAVIPARYGSTRFPGKPLVDLAGKPMIQRIFEQVSACREIHEVLVATDDKRIFEAVHIFGGEAVMTSPDCPSGTDRVAQAIQERDAQIVINIQGDQVVLDTRAVSDMVGELGRGIEMATIAVHADARDREDPNTVKVVCDSGGFALYFSRAPIPFERNPGAVQSLKHIGIYGFQRETLLRFTSLKQTPLESSESLEQLRALENGIRIRVILAQGEFFEINTPSDRERLLRLWQK
ncbi:MAG: 3-deoxy-manno-octulosonate cytidylyltransferase [Desulfomonilia bacterium]|nr:3-deoxy-manno-octulosonate cytidylyltransferase [Desulfomonilia bacterium]